MLTYHKINSAILQFVNTTKYCQRLILAYVLYKWVFQPLKYANYYDNYIYVHILSKITLKFRAQKITSKMSMRYYEITKWEEICIEEEYN